MPFISAFIRARMIPPPKRQPATFLAGYTISDPAGGLFVGNFYYESPAGRFTVNDVEEVKKKIWYVNGDIDRTTIRSNAYAV